MSQSTRFRKFSGRKILPVDPNALREALERRTTRTRLLGLGPKGDTSVQNFARRAQEMDPIKRAEYEKNLARLLPEKELAEYKKYRENLINQEGSAYSAIQDVTGKYDIYKWPTAFKHATRTMSPQQVQLVERQLSSRVNPETLTPGERKMFEHTLRILRERAGKGA